MTAHRRPLLTVAVLAASALALTGCARMPALDFPTVQQKPAHPLTAKTFLPTIGQAEGRARSFHEVLQAQSGKKSETIQADVAIAAAGLELKETIAESGQPEVDAVLVGGKLYVRTAKLDHGAWASVDLNALGKELGASAASLGISASTPEQSTELLKKAIAYVQPSGQPVVVDGVEATPYVVAIDTAAAPEFLGPLALVAGQLPAQLDYDWWVGADGLPRRYTVLADGLSEDVRYTGWNQPVTITAPVVPPAASTSTSAAGLTVAPAVFAAPPGRREDAAL